MSVNDILIKKLKAESYPPIINELDQGIELTEDSLLELSKTFFVKSYKLIIRESVPIRNVRKRVKAQSYKKTHNLYKDILNSRNFDNYNLSFCPIYIMTFSFEEQDYVYYYGKTNSSTKRFKNHKKLEQFEKMNNLIERTLHLAQVCIDFCYMGTEYTDIPLEWLEFEIDNNKDRRCLLLEGLKQINNYSSISKHREVDKIILFIENYLIKSFITSGNDRVEFPKSIYNIYTGKNSIDIFYDNGYPFIANSSPHSSDDEEMQKETIFMDDLFELEGIEDKIQSFPSVKPQSSKTLFNEFNNPFRCQELPNEDYYELWKEKSNKTKDKDDEFEFWLDDGEE